MECHLLKGIRQPVMIKPRRLLLKKSKNESSIQERITRETVMESLSTLESEHLPKLTKLNLKKNFSELNLKTIEYKNRRFPNLHDHPLIEELINHQLTRFEEFKVWAHDKFNDFD